jgi:hypothetical protein
MLLLYFLPGGCNAWPVAPCDFLYSETPLLGLSDFGFLDSLLFRICPFAIDSSFGQWSSPASVTQTLAPRYRRRIGNSDGVITAPKME